MVLSQLSSPGNHIYLQPLYLDFPFQLSGNPSIPLISSMHSPVLVFCVPPRALGPPHAWSLSTWSYTCLVSQHLVLHMPGLSALGPTHAWSLSTWSSTCLVSQHLVLHMPGLSALGPPHAWSLSTWSSTCLVSHILPPRYTKPFTCVIPFPSSHTFSTLSVFQPTSLPSYRD